MSVLALLPEYVMQLVYGEQPHRGWYQLEVHLAQCAACRSEADTLRQLMVETYTGALPPVAEAPPVALSIPARLRNRAAPPAQSRPAESRPTTAAALYSVQLSAGLLAQMQVRVAARGGELRLRYSYTFPTFRPSDPMITMEVLSADDEAERGIARVCVELADRSPFDQAGSRVTLTSGQTLMSAVTDQGGVVIFSRVPLSTIADWQISVEPRMMVVEH
jgi:anti-sigma factor RsiW